MRKLLLVLLLLSAVAAADTKIRLGGVTVGASYSSFPSVYRYSPLFWSPWYWDSWLYHPGYFFGFPYALDKGEVKLETKAAGAEVYLDGAYAGLARDLKSMWLDPGAYNLTVKIPGREPFEKRIYVLTGKTLRLKP